MHRIINRSEEALWHEIKLSLFLKNKKFRKGSSRKNFLDLQEVRIPSDRSGSNQCHLFTGAGENCGYL